MSARRQQRNTKPRGPIPFKPLAVAQDITWSWGFTDSTHATLTLSHTTGLLQLSGVPAITTNIIGLTTTAATLTGTSLALTFSGNISPSGTITVPPKDPALRTSTGGYLTAGTTPAAAPGPALVTQFSDGGHCTGDVAVGNTTLTPQTAQVDVPTTKQFIVVINDGQTMGNLLTLNNPDTSQITTLDQGNQVTLKWNGATWDIV